MKKTVYPYVALALGVMLLITLLGAEQLAAQGRPLIPLLALLIISELGLMITAIGAVVGVMAIKSSQRKLMMVLVVLACGAMSVRFMLLGIKFWPL